MKKKCTLCEYPRKNHGTLCRSCQMALEQHYKRTKQYKDEEKCQKK